MKTFSRVNGIVAALKRADELLLHQPQLTTWVFATSVCRIDPHLTARYALCTLEL